MLGSSDTLGSCGGDVTHFWNFGTPLFFSGRMKLETANVAQRWTAVSITIFCKIRPKGVTWGEGARGPLLEFLDPLIFPGRMKLKTSNLAQRRTSVSTNDKMQN